MNINNSDYVTQMRLGRIIELAINSRIYPECLLLENGLNKKNIIKIKKHIPNCKICQKLHTEHKSMSEGISQEILPFNRNMQEIYEKCGPVMLELYEIIDFKTAEEKLDKEDWNNLSSYEKKVFKQTVYTKFEFYDKEIKTLINTDAEYYCSINDSTLRKAFSKKFDEEKTKIIKTLKELLFKQFRTNLNNITYLRGSGLIYKLSSHFHRLYDKAVEEYEQEAILELENNEIEKKVKKKKSKRNNNNNDPIKILMDHIDR